MNPLRAYYAPAYAAADSTPSARLQLLADRLQRCARVELCEPRPMDIGLLQGLHSDEYTKAFLDGTAPLASSQGVAWSPAIRDSVLAMLAGQLDAADHALQHGIAMNVARGFHHAVWSRGGGLCALNGLALVAHCRPDRRIFVLDCDEHGGNGTEEFCARLGNLYSASIFGTRFGCYGGTRSWAFPVNVGRDGFATYLDALQAARTLIVEHAPDLLIYQAGVDCHRNDPKGRAGLSSLQLLQRDRWVFRMARELRVAVLFVVAGGYQDAQTLMSLNANTVRAAVNTYCVGSLAR
ncbi:acetoin utilization deacetylase AcuC-like enzyme [Tahibacter aquaticus]|uniref:Acetoin utilization deacetylase AcuC-like enzyme n=1 Tax=Tahibacter aquaticus TaxID=520092 RepID=A0A4R6YH72_9GAMM|nr:histone deacetylase [Tahibacter aquaticus]TDR35766.1 acetoin utilization deacetylase AcuC-like enzyme [Tahibacter aquaticus]